MAALRGEVDLAMPDLRSAGNETENSVSRGQVTLEVRLWSGLVGQPWA
jgi:hypothetical protein